MTPDSNVTYANSADGRALGQFQLSIATSLAIEASLDMHPDLPRTGSMPITQFRELWVNMRTLYRNIVGAMSKEIAATISSMEIAQLMAEEMEIIPDMLHHQSGRPVKVVYYFSNMNQVEAKHPEAEVRKDSTDKQKIFTQKLGDVMKIMMMDRRDTFTLVDDRLPGNVVKTLVITHIAYDLLSEKNFGQLFLLESHTGKIKPKALWYTKYYQGKTLSQIPFTEELLQVFGDNETFHPLDVKLRQAIMEVAEKRNWSSVTTRDRIIDGIGDLKNPAHVLKMKKLYRVYV